MVAQSDASALRQPRIGQSLGCSGRIAPLLAYLAFGGVAAVANLASGWLLYGSGLAPALPYWCATGAAAAVGLATNFALNYSFNLKYRDRSAIQQFWTFFAVSVVGIGLTSGLSSALRAVLCLFFTNDIQIAGLHIDFVAHFLAVGLVILYSYPAHKAISFNVGIRQRLRQLKPVRAG